MSNAHGAFIWAELMTPDTDAAARFYSHVIGWQMKHFGPPEMNYTIVEADGVGIGGIMALDDEHRNQGIPPNWTRYVAVEDVDVTAARFEEKGGRIIGPPRDIPEIGRFAVVSDPSGAVLCIMTPLPMETGGFARQQPMLHGHVGWNELLTDDVDSAMEFYGDVFGWTTDHDVDMGAMGPCRIFSCNREAAGGMMKRPPQVPVSHWAYYFTVEGLENAITRVGEGGGKVVNGPMPVPGNAWIANCQDPQGAGFSLASQRR